MAPMAPGVPPGVVAVTVQAMPTTGHAVVVKPHQQHTHHAANGAAVAAMPRTPPAPPVPAQEQKPHDTQAVTGTGGGAGAAGDGRHPGMEEEEEVEMAGGEEEEEEGDGEEGEEAYELAYQPGSIAERVINKEHHYRPTITGPHGLRGRLHPNNRLYRKMFKLMHGIGVTRSNWYVRDVVNVEGFEPVYINFANLPTGLSAAQYRDTFLLAKLGVDASRPHLNLVRDDRIARVVLQNLLKGKRPFPPEFDHEFMTVVHDALKAVQPAKPEVS